MDRISFTILLRTAADLVITASNILPAGPAGPADLAGAIGRAALRGLLPAWRRPRTRPRYRKNPSTKYRLPPGQPPAPGQPYTFRATIRFLSEGLAPRTKR
jgi:hypothetical protein